MGTITSQPIKEASPLREKGAAAAEKYAELADVSIHRDPFDPESITISYRPVSSGVVAFRRVGKNRAEKDHTKEGRVEESLAKEEKLDHVATADVGIQRKVRWSLDGLETGEAIEVKYRQDGSTATMEKTVPEAVVPAETESTVAVGRSPGLYSRRTQAGRQRWITQYGGTAKSENAVAEGLNWLARHQAADGSWSNRCIGTDPMSRCEKDAPCTDPGGQFEMAHSGLALLAFQAGDIITATTPSIQPSCGRGWIGSLQTRRKTARW